MSVTAFTSPTTSRSRSASTARRLPPKRFPEISQKTNRFEFQNHQPLKTDLTRSIAIGSNPALIRHLEIFQVGPLLDWVASLRLCIGYPDSVLVERARYLTLKKHLLPPETRKFFDYILVDEVFEWKKMNDDNVASAEGGSGKSTNVGTLRTPEISRTFVISVDFCKSL